MKDAVAVRLAEIRSREGLTIQAMADAMGVDKGQLHRALYGEGGVGRKMLDGAIRAYPEVANVYAQSLTIGQDCIAQIQHLVESDAEGCEKVPKPAEAVA